MPHNALQVMSSIQIPMRYQKRPVGKMNMILGQYGDPIFCVFYNTNLFFVFRGQYFSVTKHIRRIILMRNTFAVF